jgi:hypothetical protein
MQRKLVAHGAFFGVFRRLAPGGRTHGVFNRRRRRKMTQVCVPINDHVRRNVSKGHVEPPSINNAVLTPVLAKLVNMGWEIPNQP